MKKRHRLSRHHSKSLFKRTARRLHVRNVHAHPMRGGIRF